jgi:Tfp pilus assembly protein PilN
MLKNKAKAFLSRTGIVLGEALAFSLADERVAPGRSLSVCLENGGISAACGSRTLSRIIIEAVRHYPCEAGNYPLPEVFASTLHIAQNELRALKADITLIIPQAWIIMRSADFPLVVKNKLADVVGYELDRLTPFDAERAYYDFQVIDEDESRLKIMLTVVNAELLDPYLQALTQKGIAVKRVIAGQSAFGIFCHHAAGRGATLFLDVHPEGYEGGIFKEGRLRSFFAKRFSFDSEEEKTRTIAADVNPLIQKLRNKEPAAVVLTGFKGSLWPRLSESIAAPLRFLGEMDVKLKFRYPEKTIPYAAVGGVLESLQKSLRGMNLLDKGIHKPARIPLRMTIFLLGTLAALGLFSLAASLQTETKKVEAIDHEIAIRSNEVKRIEALKKEAAALEKEVSAIEGFKTSQPMVLNLLKELTLILPRNAWLARVRMAETTVTIEGYAASATDLLPKLESSRYFQKVEFAAPTYRDARMNADRFAIKMEMEGAAEVGKSGKK